jgi:FkbM family methyltransferase
MRTLIGKLALEYVHQMPNHRGRFRALVLLDRTFGPFRLRTPSGPTLEVFLSSPMDVSYFRNAGSSAEPYSIDQVTPRLIANLKAGECFVDVGANIGFLSFLASGPVGTTGRVISIEPSPREYARLLRGIVLNGATNVVPVNGACGESASTFALEISSYHTGLNRLVPSGAGNAKRINGDNSFAFVPVWAADSILPPLVEGRSIGLVKLDAEGAEVLILRGMRKFLAAYKPRHVVVEITPKFLSDFDTHKSEIYSIMKASGYLPKILSEDEQYDEVFEPIKQPGLSVSN